MTLRYATEDQIKGKITEINDLEYWTTAKITTQENFAAADIDADLAMVYTVPFSSVQSSTPLQIQELCAIRSAYKILTIEYRKHSHNVADYLEELKDQYDELINKYQTGQRSIVDSSGTVLSRTSGVVSNTKDVDPVFGMGTDGEYESDRSDYEGVKDTGE